MGQLSRRTMMKQTLAGAVGILGAAVTASCSAPAAAPAAPPAAQPTAASAAQPTAAPAAQPTKTPAAAPAATAKKDSVVIAQSGTGANATTMDVAQTTGPFNEQFNIFDRLVDLEFENGKVQYKPGIAESWKLVGDKTYEFTIRKGVKFHNGDVLMPSDVAFSLNRILDKNNKLSALAYFQYFAGAKVTGDNVVTITTNDPYAPAIPRLTFLNIVPEKVVTQMGEDNFALQPVGSGPYKFVEWVKGDRTTLQVFPDYYRGAQKIQKLTFRNVAEPSTRVAMLLTGEADIIDNVPPQTVAQIKSNQNFEVELTHSTRTQYFGMNVLLHPDPNPFKDIRVRQGLNYAVDWDTISKSVFYGQATRVSSDVGQLMFGYDNSLPLWPYDPQKAKDLLAAAGYADGFETEFDYYAGRNLMDKEVGVAISDMLKKNLGLKLTMNMADFGTYFQKYVSKAMKGIFFFGCGNLIADPDLCLQLNFNSKVRGLYYNSPDLDKLINTQAAAVDQQKRLGILSDAQKELQKEVPIIFGYDESYATARPKGLKWSFRPDEMMYFYGAEWQ